MYGVTIINLLVYLVVYFVIMFLFYISDLQELLLLAKDTTTEDIGMLTPPGSDFNSDSDNSPPGSPAYDEMGKFNYKYSFVCYCRF